ncbi:type 1 glutamine amidotransferase domain-containing protein [Deinococcus frigens]|uniref:type 1 glutamine amidotransferase domain-containing protein n=1 Tax=Deinococcus frigens TaxID=249403 RepID=UPI00068B75E5|nr:type 1 glutamine amidotransferase domain-containing protein [Deinococcus frigens]
MSANTNTVNPTHPKRLLLVAANGSTSQQTGWPIGAWWAEVTHAWFEFTEAGYQVDLRSPDGGALQFDGYSDPEDASGYSVHDLISLGFKKSETHLKLVQDTASLEGATVDDYDAIFLAGGQSPMYTFIDNQPLHALFAQFYEAGKIAAAICHGTCVLLKARKSDGNLIVDDKTWTGFANSEEQFADDFVGQRIQPFWIEDEARKLPNTNFIVGPRFAAFAYRDGNLITGQQQYSGAAAARLVIEALGR